MGDIDASELQMELNKFIYVILKNTGLVTENDFLMYICKNCLKIVDSRYQILWLKCNKFDFGWGSAPDPAVGAYSTPPSPPPVLSALHDEWPHLFTARWMCQHFDELLDVPRISILREEVDKKGQRIPRCMKECVAVNAKDVLHQYHELTHKLFVLSSY